MRADLAPYIEYGDKIILVSIDSDGVERVPLKKVCEMIKVDWRAQKRKLRTSSHLRNVLGVTLGVHSAPQCRDIPRQRKVWLIDLDRVNNFFNTLNLNQLLAQGNEQAVFFLLRERRKWQCCVNNYRSSHHHQRKKAPDQPLLNLDT